jgi:hypothetical protein
MVIRIRAGAIALLAATLLLQGCGTIMKGTTQRIPVTSTPPGAKVFVDGESAGTASVMLRLKKGSTALIRVESPGFTPQEIQVTRSRGKFGRFLLGNLLIASTIAYALDPNEENNGFEVFPKSTLYALIAFPLAVLFDLSGAPHYSLSPGTIDVVLKPAGESPHVERISIDEAVFREVRWLRVRTLDKSPRPTD